jgi:putative membrane protein
MQRLGYFESTDASVDIVNLWTILLVINALMLQLASFLVPGFFVAGFWSAFFGAIALSLISMVLRSLLAPDGDPLFR